MLVKKIILSKAAELSKGKNIYNTLNKSFYKIEKTKLFFDTAQQSITVKITCRKIGYDFGRDKLTYSKKLSTLEYIKTYSGEIKYGPLPRTYLEGEIKLEYRKSYVRSKGVFNNSKLC